MKVIEINNETEKVTVELFGKTAELNFMRLGDHILIFGIAVRYSQGDKIWCGEIDYWPETGKFSQPSTPMSHRSRWAHVSVVGFYKDVPEQYRSKHK